MKIYPHQDKAKHFTITDVSVQEIRNLIEALNALPGYKGPWTLGAISAMEKAIEDTNQFQLKSWR